jgi:tetratricopeptide (TPR) repeat protein
LAMHILQSPALGLNGDSPQMLAEITHLPFVHGRPDGTYKYAPPARRYFDERLRNDGVNYGELNRTIAEYLAREREAQLAKGLASDSHSVRELALHEAYHTIPADGERGMDKLQDFVEKAREPEILADTLAAVRICDYQCPYIPHERLVDACYFEGRYHYFRRDYDAALPLLEQVRNSGQRTKSVAIADHFLGVIYRDRRRLKEAAEALEEARDILESLNDRLGKAQVLNTQGTVYHDQHRLNQAVEVLEEARDIFENLNDRSSKAKVLNTLGTVYRGQRRLDEATEALKEARDIFENLNDRSSKAIVLNTLGRIYHDQGQFEESEQVLLESRDIIERLRDERGVAMVNYSLGQLYERVDRLTEARAAYARSAEINIALGLNYFARKMQALVQQLDKRLRERERAEPIPSPERDINERLQGLAEHVRSHPQDAQNRARYVALLKKTGQAEEALAVAREGWVLTPDDLWLYNSYISLLIKLRRWEEAESIVYHRVESSNDVPLTI